MDRRFPPAVELLLVILAGIILLGLLLGPLSHVWRCTWGWPSRLHAWTPPPRSTDCWEWRG